MSIFDDIENFASGAAKTTGGVLGDVGSGLGDASKTVFGDSKDAGILGLGQEHESVHPIDKQNFQDPNSPGILQDIAKTKADAQNRTAPQMTSTQIAPTATATAGHSAYTSTGPIERAGVANLGAASQTPGAVIDRSEDSQSRAVQARLMSQLEAAAGGNGIPQALARQAFNAGNESSLKSAVALEASRRGRSQPSLTSILDSTASDRLQNTANLTTAQEKATLDAQQALAALSSGVRAQDIGVSTSQAGLSDAAMRANQDATNTARLAQFGADNDLSKTNAGAFNQNQQFNTGNSLENNQFNASEQGNTNRFNATAQNTTSQEQAKIDLATKQANIEASLKAQGMSDDMVKAMTQYYMSQSEADREGNESYEQMQTNQELGANAQDQKAYEAARGARQQAVQSVGNLVASKGASGGGGDTSSDRRRKTAIRTLRPDPFDFI